MSNSPVSSPPSTEGFPNIWRTFGEKCYRPPGSVPDPVVGFYSNIKPVFLDRKLSSLRIHLSTLLNGRHARPKMSSEPRPHVSFEEYPDHKALLQAQVASLEAMAKCTPNVRYSPSEQALGFLVSQHLCVEDFC